MQMRDNETVLRGSGAPVRMKKTLEGRQKHLHPRVEVAILTKKISGSPGRSQPQRGDLAKSFRKETFVKGLFSVVALLRRMN
jgi:hypothetical protein